MGDSFLKPQGGSTKMDHLHFFNQSLCAQGLDPVQPAMWSLGQWLLQGGCWVTLGYPMATSLVPLVNTDEAPVEAHGQKEERIKSHGSVLGGPSHRERAVGGLGLNPILGPDPKGPIGSRDSRVRRGVGLAQPEGQSIPRNLLMMLEGIFPWESLSSSRGVW